MDLPGAGPNAAELGEVCKKSGASTGCSSDRNTQYTHALQTAIHTLNYERSSRTVDAIKSDEDVRKLKVQILLLQDDNDVLKSRLASEEQDADNLQLKLEDAESRSADLQDANSQLTNDLRSRIRELESTKVLCSLLA
jgi:chromosome segregation ATPase